jgi:hypothetical protein
MLIMSRNQNNTNNKIERNKVVLERKFLISTE